MAHEFNSIKWLGKSADLADVPEIVRATMANTYPWLKEESIQYFLMPAVRRNEAIYVGERTDTMDDRKFPVSLQIAFPESAERDDDGTLWRFGKLFGVFHVENGTVSVVAFAPVGE